MIFELWFLCSQEKSKNQDAIITSPSHPQFFSLPLNSITKNYHFERFIPERIYLWHQKCHPDPSFFEGVRILSDTTRVILSPNSLRRKKKQSKDSKLALKNTFRAEGVRISSDTNSVILSGASPREDLIFCFFFYPSSFSPFAHTPPGLSPIL